MARTRTASAHLNRASPRLAEQKGEVLLKALAPSLKKRGVPTASYVMVNILSGEFVTGKTLNEAAQRFKNAHPDGIGWVRRFGDIVGEDHQDPSND